MPTVNLAAKYETKLDERYHLQSRTDRACGNNYNWEGANSIKVWTLESAALNDYDNTASSNRFGTPSEVDDELHTYALTRKKSFAKVFDVTNVQDQMFVKKANAYLKQMWDERYVPDVDGVRLAEWAKGAGAGASGSALTKSTVMEALLKAHAALDDAYVPNENRFNFVRSDVAVATKLASELNNNQTYTSKAIIRGQIGEINGSPVITVPYNLMPKGVAFMVKYKNASADPLKLRMLRANDNAPGYAGTLMEGLCRYDSFVLANKAEGIYIYADGTGVGPIPAISFTGSTVTILATGNTALYYTLDGSNPKQNASKSTYSTAFSCTTAGTVVRAYATKSGSMDSPIATFVVGG